MVRQAGERLEATQSRGSPVWGLGFTSAFLAFIVALLGVFCYNNPAGPAGDGVR